MSLSVGTTVRASIPGSKTYKRKAVVATAGDVSQSLCLLWDDSIRPISSFLISPCFEEESDGGETEDTVDVKDIEPLHHFEISDQNQVSVPDSELVLQYKSHGDILLKTGDPASAVPFYEEALQRLNKIELGGGCVVKEKGFLRYAEIDCIDANQLDLCIPESGREFSCSVSSVIIFISHDPVQSLILLNLTRCLVSLSEIASASQMKRRPAFLKAAVLASSIVVTKESRNKEDAGATKRRNTALLLRSRSQLGLSKFQQARADARNVLQSIPDHQEAIRLVKLSKEKEMKLQVSNKKLVREVCKWVDTAASEAKNNPVSGPEGEKNSERKVTSSSMESLFDPTTIQYTFCLLMILFFAFIIQSLL